MIADERELERLLGMVAGHVDLQHYHKADERYRRALSYEDVDHPPLVVLPPYPTSMKLPDPWNEFRRYAYREAFHDPIAMLQHVPGAQGRPDEPASLPGRPSEREGDPRLSNGLRLRL